MIDKTNLLLAGKLGGDATKRGLVGGGLVVVPLVPRIAKAEEDVVQTVAEKNIRALKVVGVEVKRLDLCRLTEVETIDDGAERQLVGKVVRGCDEGGVHGGEAGGDCIKALVDVHGALHVDADVECGDPVALGLGELRGDGAKCGSVLGVGVPRILLVSLAEAVLNGVELLFDGQALESGDVDADCGNPRPLALGELGGNGAEAGDDCRAVRVPRILLVSPAEASLDVVELVGDGRALDGVGVKSNPEGSRLEKS